MRICIRFVWLFSFLSRKGGEERNDHDISLIIQLTYVITRFLLAGCCGSVPMYVHTQMAVFACRCLLKWIDKYPGADYRCSICVPKWIHTDPTDRSPKCTAHAFHTFPFLFSFPVPIRDLVEPPATRGVHV